MSSWFKSFTKRLKRIFFVRKTRDLSENERDTCERYGEQVIATMLAGGFRPDFDDLRSIYRDQRSRQHARDWLTERADYQSDITDG